MKNYILYLFHTNLKKYMSKKSIFLFSDIWCYLILFTCIDCIENNSIENKQFKFAFLLGNFYLAIDIFKRNRKQIIQRYLINLWYELNRIFINDILIEKLQTMPNHSMWYGMIKCWVYCVYTYYLEIISISFK